MSLETYIYSMVLIRDMVGWLEMNKESLKKAREEIIKTLSNLDIDLIDRLELLINMNELLQENRYEEGIKVLRKSKK
jgi:hypothetical protein